MAAKSGQFTVSETGEKPVPLSKKSKEFDRRVVRKISSPGRIAGMP